LALLLFSGHTVFAQPTPNPDTSNWFLSPGIIGTIVLIFIVLAVVVVIVYIRLSTYLDMMNHKAKTKKKLTFSDGSERKDIFVVTGSETPKAIPAWVWALLIAFVAFALFYLIMYWKPDLYKSFV
jgi:ABC-type uncharacterized transport system permease subunit